MKEVPGGDEIWPFVETFILPALVIIGLLTFISFRFYLVDIKNLRMMEGHLKSKGNLRSFKYQSFISLWPIDFYYGFYKLVKIDTAHLKIQKFGEQVKLIRAYRSYYRIVVLGILLLAIIGIAINEIIIDR